MEAIRCRQIVDERLQQATGQLSTDIVPRMIPMASMMGQVSVLYWILKTSHAGTGGGEVGVLFCLLPFQNNKNYAIMRRTMEVSIGTA
jgi:Cu/Ag efflux pump CusA